MLNRIKRFSRMIKVEHTVFALPYAYLGMILASFNDADKLPGWQTFLWVTLAMFGARSSAMALNRWIDRHIDASNPRTANREIPKGLISIPEVAVFTVISLLILAVSSWMLNPLCFALLPVAVLFLIVYPYTKRFTWLCHIVLGLTDALAPLGGWIAVSGKFEPAAWVLAGAVGAWIAGFDIIYACQDVEIDRKQGIHSIPARFGVRAGLTMSTLLHIATVILFLLLPQFARLGWFYYGGVAVVAVLLWLEHRMISPQDMSRIQQAFFTVNSYIAAVAFLFTLADVMFSLF